MVLPLLLATPWERFGRGFLRQNIRTIWQVWFSWTTHSWATQIRRRKCKLKLCKVTIRRH